MYCKKLNSTLTISLISRLLVCVFFFSSRRRHTRFDCDWSSDVCSSDLCVGRRQPVLCGTVSIEKTEALSELLTKKKIPHQVLNARYHEQEAYIIAQAEIGRASCRERV